MEISEIKSELELAINKWRGLVDLKQKQLILTDGAVEVITQMIVNIEKDPSPYWADIDTDSVQRFTISIIPNIMIDMSYRYHRHHRHHWHKQKVSSWEILHNISEALDKWCPVPKDI